MMQPSDWILEAVARGWCSQRNESKTMDSALAEDIAKEVTAALTAMPDDLLRKMVAERGCVMVSREPTETMLESARDWSYVKYGKPIGNDAATGCWSAMLAAAPKPGDDQ